MKTSLKRHCGNICLTLKTASFIRIIMAELKESTTRLKYLIESHMVIGILRTLRIGSHFISNSDQKQHVKQTKKKNTPNQHKTPLECD